MYVSKICWIHGPMDSIVLNFGHLVFGASGAVLDQRTDPNLEKLFHFVNVLCLDVGISRCWRIFS